MTAAVLLYFSKVFQILIAVLQLLLHPQTSVSLGMLKFLFILHMIFNLFFFSSIAKYTKLGT